MNKNGTSKGHADERLGSIRESVKSLVDRSEQRAHAIKDRMAEMTDTVRTRGTDAIDRTSDLIKAYPLTAIGIAFGIGYLAMRLFRR